MKALSAPFGQARFCPTGGMKQDTAPDWLALPSVLCVGGSWFLQSEDGIAERARAAAALRA